MKLIKTIIAIIWITVISIAAFRNYIMVHPEFHQDINSIKYYAIAYNTSLPGIGITHPGTYKNFNTRIDCIDAVLKYAPKWRTKEISCIQGYSIYSIPALQYSIGENFNSTILLVNEKSFRNNLVVE